MYVLKFHLEKTRKLHLCLLVPYRGTKFLHFETSALDHFKNRSIIKVSNKKKVKEEDQEMLKFKTGTSTNANAALAGQEAAAAVKENLKDMKMAFVYSGVQYNQQELLN